MLIVSFISNQWLVRFLSNCIEQESHGFKTSQIRQRLQSKNLKLLGSWKQLIKTIPI